MNDEKKPFTVKDRRHFTADGSARDDAAPGGEQQSSASPDQTSAGEGPAAEGPARGGPASEDAAREDAATEAAAPDEPVTLTGFLAGLATQASLLLGLIAPPGEKAPSPDLQGARHVISILEMLEEKTRGNRSAEEDRAIEAILYELRMAFVQVAGRAS
jgi:hypothetical protein